MDGNLGGTLGGYDQLGEIKYTDDNLLKLIEFINDPENDTLEKYLKHTEIKEKLEEPEKPEEQPNKQNKCENNTVIEFKIPFIFDF